MGRSIGNLKTQGLPMPIVPTENTGIMSGSMRKKREGRRRDERGSRSDIQLGRVTQPDGSTLITYGPRRKGRGGSIGKRRGYPAIRPDGRGIKEPPLGMKYDEIDRLVPIDTPPLVSPRPEFDPSKPSAVMETELVNVKDPTLGGPPEREVPIPKERDTSPRGPAPFSPDERAMARDAFFEKMFSRADARKQQKDMEREDMRETRRAIKDERMARRSEPSEIDIDAERGGRRRRGRVRTNRRGRRRDFTRRRSRMEGRRSREERAAFRDRYVSTLGSNFFS